MASDPKVSNKSHSTGFTELADKIKELLDGFQDILKGVKVKGLIDGLDSMN